MADTKIIVDCSTGAVTEIELTEEEVAQRESDAAAYAAKKAQEEADARVKAEAKAALLERLGMTAEEAALLLS
jgi:hypothetical protein